MVRYILRRIIQMIPTLIGISIVTFLLVHLAPGSPVTSGYAAMPTAGNVEDETRLYAKHYFLHLPLFLNLDGNFATGDSLLDGFLDCQCETGQLKAVERAGNGSRVRSQIKKRAQKHVAADARKQVE